MFKEEAIQSLQDAKDLLEEKRAELEQMTYPEDDDWHEQEGDHDPFEHRVSLPRSL